MPGFIDIPMTIFSGIHGYHDLCDANIYIVIKTSINHVSITLISGSKENWRVFWWVRDYIFKYRLLTDLMPSKFKMDPRTGTLLMKPTTTGKKPLGEEKTALWTCTFLITKINC